MTQERNTRFWDKIARKYAKRPVADQAAYERKLEMTRAYLTPSSQVLEFGCGTGTTALLHAPHAAEIVAIDYAANMIAIAREKSESQGIANVRFEQADFADFDAPDKSFDMVMGHSILHLLDDPDAAIAKAFRLLRPGGVFVTSTSCLEDGLGFLRYIIPAMRLLGFAPSITFLSSEDLLRRMRTAGFEIAEHWAPGKGKAVFIIAAKPAG